MLFRSLGSPPAPRLGEPSSITAGCKVEGCEIRPAGLIDRSVGRVCASLSVTLCWSDVGTSDIGTAGPGRGVSLTMIESLRKVGAGVGGWGWSGVGARGVVVWGKDGFREPEVGGAAATTPEGGESTRWPRASEGRGKISGWLLVVSCRRGS